MKKFVIEILLFAAVSAVGVMLLVCSLGGTGWLRNVQYSLGLGDHTLTRSREAEVWGPVDVLFVGSSHSYRTFDPRVFERHGLRVFNLGSSNQTPVQSEVLLHRYLEKLSPRLVVVEVHPDIIGYDGVESSLYWLSNSAPSWHNVPMVVRSANAKVLCTAIFSTKKNLGRSFRRYVEPEVIEGNRYVSGGYVEREVECWHPTPQPTDTVHFLSSQLHALRRMVSTIEEAGAECLLLEVPDTRMLEGALVGLDEFRERMRMYGDFHCPRPPQLDDSLHFFDPGHLNQKGAEIYDEYIIDLIYEHIGTDVGHLARRSGSGAVCYR